MDRSSFEASRERARQRELEGHPAPGDLAAYHAGRLTEERTGQIKDHLTVCGECALLLDSLVEFEQYRPEPLPSGEDPSAAAWLRFRDRLREEEAADAPQEPVYEQEEIPEVEPERVLHRERAFERPRPWLPWTVAAALAVFVVGQFMQTRTLRDQVRTLRPNSEVRLVSSIELSTHRGEEEMKSLPGGGILVLTPGDSSSDYEVEIVPRSGGDPVAGPIRGKSDGNLLILDIPHSFLPEGVYTARIYRIQDGQRQPLEDHDFRISPAE